MTVDRYGNVVGADISRYLPVKPYTDIFEKMRESSSSYMLTFYNRLCAAVENLTNAVNVESDHEAGIYGPYCQSNRENLYRIVIKELMKQGRVYPCFCTPDDLNELRSKQEANKENPGYYGEYAKCRNLTVDEAIAKIENGEHYVLRFKSNGSYLNRIEINDMVRGQLELAQNDQDIVVLKSDGLPTYHFAHVIDDHLMHTTHIIRGDEWLPSLPLHYQLFRILNQKI